MAKMTFSLEELAKILIANGLLPGEVLRPRAEGDRIRFVISTGSFILPFVPGSLRYLGFTDNKAIFEVSLVSAHLNKAVSRLNQTLQLKMPTYMKLDYPRLLVDVDMLVKEKNIRGIRVKDIFFEDGQFTIVTCNI